MNINKYLMLGGVALGLGLTSCVGDLDLEPIDPNLESPESSTILINEAMQCYQTMATSGQEGPGPLPSRVLTTAADNIPAQSS